MTIAFAPNCWPIVAGTAPTTVLPDNDGNENKFSTEAARGKGAGDTTEVDADEAGDASCVSPPEANEEDGSQQNLRAPSEHRNENGATVETHTAALDGDEGVSNGSIANGEGPKAEVEAGEATGMEAGEILVGREGRKAPKGSTSSGNCGADAGEKGCPVSNRDSDFDCLLADYVEGPFGEAGGGLLIPLGGLRLLR